MRASACKRRGEWRRQYAPNVTVNSTTTRGSLLNLDPPRPSLPTKRGLPQLTASLVKEIDEGVQGYPKQ